MNPRRLWHSGRELLRKQVRVFRFRALLWPGRGEWLRGLREDSWLGWLSNFSGICLLTCSLPSQLWQAFFVVLWYTLDCIEPSDCRLQRPQWQTKISQSLFWSTRIENLRLPTLSPWLSAELLACTVIGQVLSTSSWNWPIKREYRLFGLGFCSRKEARLKFRGLSILPWLEVVLYLQSWEVLGANCHRCC